MNILCLNRIKKDFEEITNSPLEGIGIVPLDNEPMKYVVNIKIISGVFRGYCLQLLLIFLEKYPFQPPQILIYPNQLLDNINPQHIKKTDLKDAKGFNFKELYFYLLKNDISLISSKSYTGWKPNYTISTLLLQVQKFLSNPDFPNSYLPSKEKIDRLIKSMDDYENTFETKNNNNEKVIKVHTRNTPYPEMYFKNCMNSSDNNTRENGNNYKSYLCKTIKENLTCFLSRLNYIDNKTLILGYPIKELKNGGLLPIPEILSYDCFIEESSKNNNNKKKTLNKCIFFPVYNYDDITLNTNERKKYATNFLIKMRYFRYINYFLFSKDSCESTKDYFYDYWLPIYINAENFQKNERNILTSFIKIKYENTVCNNINFYIPKVFEVLVNLLSEMIKKIIDKNISPSFLICFFQYALMFKKLKSNYNNYFNDYQNDFLRSISDKIEQSWYEEINMDIKKDLLELLIIFLFSNNEIDLITKIRIHNHYIMEYKNLAYLELFKNKNISDFIDVNSLTKDLKKSNLFYGIFNLIDIDLKSYYDSEKERLFIIVHKEQLIKKISENFLGFYYSLDLKLKQKINVILFKELNFSNYIKKNDLYIWLNFKFNALDKSYKFISVFLFLREKILNERFMNKLEENFGVCLEAEYLINELKNIGDSFYMDKYETLKKYNLFSIMELIILDSLYKNKKIDTCTSIRILLHKDKVLYKTIKNIIMEEKNIAKYKTKEIKKKIKINYKEKIKRDIIIMKKNCDKNYNKRINKYTYNKKYK